MAITYEPADTWRGRGRPPVAIPEDISRALEHTYATDTVAVIDAEEDDPSTIEVLALMRLYCRRQKKQLAAQFFDGADGKTYLRFRMRDTRVYKHQIVTARRVRR